MLSDVTQITDARLSLQAMSVYHNNLEQARDEPRQYASVLCRKATDTSLPPLQDINHRIPIIDPKKKYSWRPVKCPDAMRSQWIAKRDNYIKSGRWLTCTSYNTVPMLLIPKPGKPGEPPQLRTVADLQERNSNTEKLASPLPDIEGILCRIACCKYRSIADGQDAYKQTRIHPDDVHLTAMNTPDSAMLSQVIQIGDINAAATFQAMMVHLFSPYLGRWLDIYLDDIIIYTDTLEEHVANVKMVIDILKREQFYLSEKKLKFLCPETKILGRIIDDNGIQMDPDKVNALVCWKTPTNQDLLCGFLGSAGFLADDIDRVRLPMGLLHKLTGDTVPFRWDYTHQCAFEDVKHQAVICRDHH